MKEGITGVIAIVQARLSSTRLKGKVLKPILGRPLLWYVVSRLQRAAKVHKVLVATSIDASDDALAEWCAQEGIGCYRGNLDDVLERFASAADQELGNIIVRICGDCPLIDPAIVDKAIEEFCTPLGVYDYMSNTLERTYPRGMDVEVFSIEALNIAAHKAQLQPEREHVTPYLYLHPERFRLGAFKQDIDQSHLRLTVDTERDLQLITLLLEELLPRNPHFDLQDIIECLQKHPDWQKINAEVQQKELGL
jgi:spore coat polysaccharide biosynthesis protein SpsF